MNKRARPPFLNYARFAGGTRSLRWTIAQVTSRSRPESPERPGRATHKCFQSANMCVPVPVGLLSCRRSAGSPASSGKFICDIRSRYHIRYPRGINCEAGNARPGVSVNGAVGNQDSTGLQALSCPPKRGAPTGAAITAAPVAAPPPRLAAPLQQPPAPSSSGQVAARRVMPSSRDFWLTCRVPPVDLAWTSRLAQVTAAA